MFYETRMHTRSGRLSLVLRIHPTQVGERALIWCRAGICFEDFEAHTGEIAAACYAREARIERSKRWAQLVQVNIVRRDTLAAHNVIASSLAAKVPAAPGQERRRMTSHHRRLRAAGGKPPETHPSSGGNPPRHQQKGRESAMCDGPASDAARPTSATRPRPGCAPHASRTTNKTSRPGRR